MPIRSIAKRILEVKGDASYADFATAIKSKTGKDIHPTTIQKIVNGDRKPSLDLLETIAAYANLPLKSFFEETSDIYVDLNSLEKDHEKIDQLRELAAEYKVAKNNIDSEDHKIKTLKKEIQDSELEIEKIMSKVFRIPILGYVPAGGPVMVEENIEGHIPLPALLLKSSTDFCLRIQGDSMEDVGINNGDLVLVHPQPTAENGQTVIARINGEVTCKRFYKLDNKCRLEPANSKYKPLDCEDIEIIGIVLKVIKEVF